MKRLHVHVSVADLAASARFYSTLFAAEPTVAKPDYVKWLLDDPRVNFATRVARAPQANACCGEKAADGSSCTDAAVVGDDCITQRVCANKARELSL